MLNRTEPTVGPAKRLHGGKRHIATDSNGLLLAAYVQSQTILIEVLGRDGHDVSDYERELAKERSGLATRIARQFRLLEIASANEGPETAASTQG